MGTGGSIILAVRRRDFALTIGAAAALVKTQVVAGQTNKIVRKGRLKQSAMRVNFPADTPLEDICREAARLGCHGLDLIAAKDWPVLRKYGLLPTIANEGPLTFEDGLIRPRAGLEKDVAAHIDQCADGGCPAFIAVGGQRKGMSYEEGADRAVAFLNQIKPHAEGRNVGVYLEVMNQVDRPDQICNHLDWGVNVCKRVNSPKIKMLFDIYHVQIMDGDVCHRIRENFQWIGHFHTAGVPGRHEIDGTQELNYHFIAQTIADLGYGGYVAHEHRPSPGHDPVKSLAIGLDIMDV